MRIQILSMTLCWVPGIACAQAYPAKPVRIIVPYTPGGATDILGRLLAAKFGESLGQQFIAENRPGAAGLVGAELAARAAPDGYTLWVGQASNLAINQHLMKNFAAKSPTGAASSPPPVRASNKEKHRVTRQRHHDQLEQRRAGKPPGLRRLALP